MMHGGQSPPSCIGHWYTPKTSWRLEIGMYVHCAKVQSLKESFRHQSNDCADLYTHQKGGRASEIGILHEIARFTKLQEPT